jgi:hypothetical protein
MLTRQARIVRGVTGPGGSGAVGANHPIADLPRQPVAVLDEEAARAGELVALLRDHANGEFLTGEIGARQFEVLEFVAVIDIEYSGRGVVATTGQLLERFIDDIIGFLLAGRVVISGHFRPFEFCAGVTTT